MSAHLRSLSIISLRRTSIKPGITEIWDNDGKEKEPIEECEDFDEILEMIGSQGKFQKLLLYGFLGPISLLAPLFMFNIVFMLSEPDHWCFVDGRNGTDIEAWKNSTIPRVVGPDGKMRFSECSMYNEYGQGVKCQNGWEYDRTYYEQTMSTEFNWVCDKSQYSTVALTMASVGNALGTLLFGPAADTYGRKTIIFLLFFINVFFRIVSLYLVDFYEIFLCFQVLVGTACPLMYILSTMLACESSNTDYRAWIYSFTWIIWVVGFATLPLFGWLTRNWYNMGLFSTLPGVLLFAYWWWVPESPRWLVSKGKIAKAKTVINKIAIINGTHGNFTQEKLDAMLKTLTSDEEEENFSLLDIFKNARLAKNTLLITIMWVTNNVVNFGITLNANKLNGNQFINFFILAITEVPSAYIGGVLADKMGRRWTQVIFYTACMATCLAAGAGLVWFENDIATICFIVVAKIAITLTFLVVYIQVTEIFPTQVRSTGSGFASTVASAATILAPYTVYLGRINAALPYIFFGGVSFFGTVAAAFMPETLNQKLPETIEEANNLGKNEKFWSFCPHGTGKEVDKEKQKSNSVGKV